MLSLFKNPYHQYLVQRTDFFKNPWSHLGEVLDVNMACKFHNTSGFVEPEECSIYSFTDWTTHDERKIRRFAIWPGSNNCEAGRGIFYRPETIPIRKLPQLCSTKEENKDFQYYRKYYLEEVWRQELDIRSIEIINDRPNVYAMRQFNHEIKGKNQWVMSWTLSKLNLSNRITHGFEQAWE